MVYEWKKASHIKVDAQIAGQQCEELSNTVGLTAKNLLDANRSNEAPLHSEFEWDDSIAAEKHREAQARHIINCLCVVPEIKHEEVTPIRAFFTLTSSEYEPLNVIVKNTDKYTMLLNNALAELETFQRKYAILTDLNAVFAAINEVRSQHEKTIA